MIAVLSFALRAPATNAALGAESIDAVHDLRIRNVNDGARVFGTGIRARNMDEGKWVKTIVWIFPILLASEAAMSIEIAWM